MQSQIFRRFRHDSFSLYLPAIYHFACSIKSTKSKQDAPTNIKFTECLRRVIGRRSEADTLPILKAYLRHVFKSSSIQNGVPAYEQSDEYIEQRVKDHIEWMKREGVHHGHVLHLEKAVKEWRIEHRMKPQRLAAAKARWRKEESEKSIDTSWEI